MTIAPKFPRELGTMVAYGFTGLDFTAELALAHRLGATVLEILPDWRRYPDPRALRAPVADAGLSIHSAHGCWGGQAIRAPRVDLGSCDPTTHLASVDDLKRCVDWLAEAGRPIPGRPSRRPLRTRSGRRASRCPGAGPDRAGRARTRPGPDPRPREHAARGLPRQSDGRPLRPHLRAGPARTGPHARHRPRPHRRDRRVRNGRRRPSPRDHPRPRQRRPTGLAPPPRARLHRLGGLGRGPRCHPLSRPDHARMYPAHSPQPAMSRFLPPRSGSNRSPAGPSDPKETPTRKSLSRKGLIREHACTLRMRAKSAT